MSVLIIHMRTSGKHRIEADFYEIDEDGVLYVRDRGATVPVAAFAADAWASIQVEDNNKGAA